MPPKVSVCITTYNYAQKIGRAIKSVLVQDYSDYEIIVSDDASTDNTEEVVRRFTDPRISYFKNPLRLGFPRNMNIILGLATADYVVFLCADDCLFPGFLKKESALLDTYATLSFVHCLPSSVSSIHLRPEFDWPKITRGRDFILGLFSGHKCYFFSSVMARRKDIWAVGGFDPDFPYNTDQYTWLRLALKGDVGYLAEPLVGSDWSRGILSKIFAYQGRYVIEELRLKSKFIDSLDRKTPELFRLKHRLTYLLCRTTMRNCLSLRTAGEDIRVIMDICKQCASRYPMLWVNLAAWIYIIAAILPTSFLKGVKHYLRKGRNAKGGYLA